MVVAHLMRWGLSRVRMGTFSSSRRTRLFLQLFLVPIHRLRLSFRRRGRRSVLGCRSLGKRARFNAGLFSLRISVEGFGVSQELAGRGNGEPVVLKNEPPSEMQRVSPFLVCAMKGWIVQWGRGCPQPATIAPAGNAWSGCWWSKNRNEKARKTGESASRL